jgi:vitamin B12 transporter
MQITSLSRLSGWFSFILVCVASVVATKAQTAPTPAPAPTESVSMDRFVVSASRTPQDPLFTPSAVASIRLDELDRDQIVDLRTALSREPGVIVVNSGPAGSLSSVFLRGASEHQTLFVVDGVRMNDRSASYNNFLGAANLNNLGRLEVLRGPQSTLYGSSAMGGVILIESGRGDANAPFGVISATGGSFDTYGASYAASGGEGKLTYSGSVARFVTSNDAPYNDFKNWSYSMRLEYNVNANVLVGATFRGQNGDYQQTGSRFFYSPGEVGSKNYLGTVFGQVKVSDTFMSRLTYGLHERYYTFTDQYGVSDLRNARKIVDWQNTWQATPQIEVVAGTNFEWSRYTVDGGKSYDEVRAGYVSTTARPVKNVTLTGGLRFDDFKSIGSATTWRLGASWLPVVGTKVRATYGTGFTAPGSDDRYGVKEFGQEPNPNIRPEKSKGWDIGVDQDLIGGKANVSVTYFNNRFRDLFAWEYTNLTTFTGRVANISRAATSGVEFGGTAKIGSKVTTRLAYTYLDATDKSSGQRLIRRPRHVVDAEVTVQIIDPLLIGIGSHGVANRMERSAPGEDYTTVRVFASYALKKNIVLKLRVENALDETYEEVLGYPALPLGVFGGIEWRF